MLTFAPSIDSCAASSPTSGRIEYTPRRSMRLGVTGSVAPWGGLRGFSFDSAACNLPPRSRLHRSSFRNLAYARAALYLLRLVDVDHSLSYSISSFLRSRASRLETLHT